MVKRTQPFKTRMERKSKKKTEIRESKGRAATREDENTTTAKEYRSAKHKKDAERCPTSEED